MAPLLEVLNLSASYGHVQALRSASFKVAPGEFVAVLGPNGAGKSTLLKVIMRLVPSQGSVMFDGATLEGRRADELAKLGIAFVPEGRGILGAMTVQENLDLGSYCRHRKTSRRELDGNFAAVFALFPRLKERQRQRAGLLSGGEQQILALGRAMMSNPKLLILDEPSLGLAPRIVEDVFMALERLNRDGLTVLVVEQKAPLVLKLATTAHVMQRGRLVATIDPKTINSPHELARYYLGDD